MPRLKKYLDTRASDNQERWLVSYADFITLLLAFFVVMYAVSSVNESKYRVVGTAIGSAFGSGGAAAGAPMIQGPVVSLPLGSAVRAEAARARREERMQDAERELAAALGPLVADGQANVRRSGRGVVIDIGAGALFATGDAVLQPAVRTPLGAAAAVLKGLDLPLEIEGHTDDKPIQGGQYPSNWELSSARASSVVRFFQGLGIAPERMSAVGYAEFRPVTSNAHAEGRARNRRISITVVDLQPLTGGAAGAGVEPTLSYPPMEFKIDPR